MFLTLLFGFVCIRTLHTCVAYTADDDIRRKAEELLARKKALLEEAARKHKSASSSSTSSSSSSLSGDADRLRRAEEYRQVYICV